ncbi:hypothetical protein [Alicyclobacillus dauci]|uniref:Uncharacterized protein n=1 Tax=Alicyclobacillus dauci TaxID=1475485 RepID=A0ABY6Z8N5_9BACL|nr:hypothetical protein [Alicyclobacillus dauci]WAH38420.1 hypothetical protein NZD86_08055 [Alicyclobacillus dauci]
MRRTKSLLVSLMVTVSVIVSLLMATVRPVYADSPAMVDFGQTVPLSPKAIQQWASDEKHALFVTEVKGGECHVEEHIVHDDAITAFVSEHPAWQLNALLTWYFVEPVYQRNNTQVTWTDGRTCV